MVYMTFIGSILWKVRLWLGSWVTFQSFTCASRRWIWNKNGFLEINGILTEQAAWKILTNPLCFRKTSKQEVKESTWASFPDIPDVFLWSCSRATPEMLLSSDKLEGLAASEPVLWLAPLSSSLHSANEREGFLFYLGIAERKEPQEFWL